MGPNRKNRGKRLLKKIFCNVGCSDSNVVLDVKPLIEINKNRIAKQAFPRFLFPLDANRINAFNNENKVTAMNMKRYKFINLEAQQ